MKIYVGNLSFDSTDEDLRELFEGYGAVESAEVVMDKYTGRSRGFGFVEMPDKSVGEKAIQELDGNPFMGRELKVNEARPRQDNRDRGRGRGRSNDRW